jgi:6-phosphogluconolactonase (cycloisomerase 2 family)
VSLDPKGRFVYVNGQDGAAGYRIDPETGGLTAMGDLAVHGPYSPLVIEPSGHFAYRAQGWNIHAYSIDADSGELDPLGTVASGPAVFLVNRGLD